MILTGKCKKDFEKWFLNKYKHRADKSTNFLSPTFYEMDYPFQYGVYLQFIREKRNVLISVYRNGSGYLWNMEKADCGTDLGYSAFNGNCEYSGSFKTYDDAMISAIELECKYGLKVFGIDEKDKFHWSNYAGYIFEQENKTK